MTARLQRVNESRSAYLRSARAYARRQLNQLLATAEFRHCHESHAVAAALEATEKQFPDLGTCGVESFEHNGRVVYYLNSGDAMVVILICKGR